MRKRQLVSAVALLSASGLALATSAAAAPPPPPPSITVASGLVGPLSVAADAGRYYVTENFAGRLLRVRKDKAPVPLYVRPAAEIGGVSARNGRVVFTVTKDQEKGPPTAVGKVLRLVRPGKARVLANTAAYEARYNPDKVNRYGLVGTPESCLSQMPPPAVAGLPSWSYRGIVDSHPYATAQSAGGTVYVADAAANVVFAIHKGKLRVARVLPPTPIKVTPELKASLEALINSGGPDTPPPPVPVTLPECIVGQTFYSEAVPTDVEVAPNGQLFVTSLPGGAGDGGPYGAVYRINPVTKHLTRVARGLTTPTDLALSPRGDIYVTELFKGTVTKLARKTYKPSTFATVALPAAIEWTARGLLTTINAVPEGEGPPAGKVVLFTRPLR